MLSGCQKKKITYHPTSYLMTKESGKNYPALKTQKKFEDAFAMTKLSAKKDTTQEKTDRKSDETLKEENAPAVQETDMADRINNQTSDEKRVSQKEQKSKRNSSTSSKKDSADTKTKKAATEKSRRQTVQLIRLRSHRLRHRRRQKNRSQRRLPRQSQQ